jgi:hypothetical protein
MTSRGSPVFTEISFIFFDLSSAPRQNLLHD